MSPYAKDKGECEFIEHKITLFIYGREVVKK